MKNKLVLLSFLLILFLLPTAHSNRVWVMDNRGSVSILHWEETNVIKDNDLFVSVLFNVNVKNQSPTYVPLLFYPQEDLDMGNSPAENVLITVCKGEPGGHSYGDIHPNCIREVDFSNVSEPKHPNYVGYEDYKNYIINISKNNLKENENFLIKINYTIPNFLNNETEKLILLRTDCSGPEGSCPPPDTGITKYLLLPKNAAIRQYPTEAVLDTFEGKLLIKLNNFSPVQTAGHPEYENKAILYTDLDAIKKREFNILLLGIMISLILTIILTSHYYKQSKKDLIGKLNTAHFNKKYKFLNDELHKLKNLIKSKRRYKKRK